VTISSRRQLLFLLALVLIGGAILVLRSPSATVGNGGDTAPADGSAQASRQVNPVGDVRLESLEDHRGEEQPAPSRDLFRFESKPVASASPGGPRPPVNPILVDPGPPAPTGPPPPPPIPLRYIGYLDQPGAVPRVAVLSDGRGNVFNGKEGDIIEGRYRVLRIGSDSADLIYVDGRGRQTIRLSGQ
jgi:hypothetical protein